MKHLLHSCIILTLLVLANGLSAQHQSALDFDGIDDGLRLSSGAQLAAGATELSMACWVNLKNDVADFPDFDGILGIRDELSADFYMLQLTASSIEARFRNSNNEAFTIEHQGGFQIGSWQHLALTYTGSMLRFYINGIAVDSIAATGVLGNSTGDLTIGFIDYQAFRFSLIGQMDEVGFWERALSTAEINCIMNTRIPSSSPGLLAYFDFNQGQANSDNSLITSLSNAVPLGDAIPEGFTLTGTTSNFIDGIPTQSDTGVTQTGTILVSTNTSATYQWINCTTGLPIPAAINQSYSATQNGSYAVVITECALSDTSACYTINSVGLESIRSASSMLLYPNPTDNIIHLQLPHPDPSAQLIISNMLGQTVFQSSVLSSDVSFALAGVLPTGIYRVHLVSGTNSQSQLLRMR